MDIEYQLQDIRFQWDENKAQSNVLKHGITFEEAAEVFFDPFHQTGDASTGDEQRDFVFGYSFQRRILLVVYVERGQRTRIISARRATRHERKSYGDP